MQKMKIEITRETFKRLQKNSEPLVDNHDTIINKALDTLEHSVKSKGKSSRSTHENKIVLCNPEDFSHTKIQSAIVDGKKLSTTDWKVVFYHIIELALNKGYSVEKMNENFSTRLVQGVRTDGGYYPVPGLNLSVPALSANESCKLIKRISDELSIRVTIECVMR